MFKTPLPDKNQSLNENCITNRNYCSFYLGVCFIIIQLCHFARSVADIGAGLWPSNQADFPQLEESCSWTNYCWLLTLLRMNICLRRCLSRGGGGFLLDISCFFSFYFIFSMNMPYEINLPPPYSVEERRCDSCSSHHFTVIISSDHEIHIILLKNHVKPIHICVN